MIQPRKRYGQHFLHDANIVNRIVREISPNDDEHLVEIGGGLGALTKPLSQLVRRLDVVEVDQRLAEELKRDLENIPAVIIHHADALKFNFGVLRSGPEKLRVVGNLPYNISTPILFHVLGFRTIVSDMHFMLQKEVVDRMTASPGNKTYGRLTIMLSRWTEITKCFDIRPGSFLPPPKVMSSMVRLKILETPRFPVRDEQAFAKLVSHLFSMRRKTIGRSLRGMISHDKLAQLEIDPRTRAETLAPAVFAQLADLLE